MDKRNQGNEHSEDGNRRSDPSSLSGQKQSYGLSPVDVTGSSLTAAMHTGFGIGTPFTREIRLKSMQAIVGMRFQGGALDLIRDLKPGSRITFIHELENQYDRNAVMALDEQGRKLGYIPRMENAILSALMDAGKYIYGIVTKIPEHGYDNGGSIPTTLYVALYLQEFAAPDGMIQIPRQGYQGSYAVMDLETEEDGYGADADIGNPTIQSVFAIRVINGEERGIFAADMQGEGQDPAAEVYEKLIQDLRGFIGYLPVVVHDSTGRAQEALETGWGLYTGHPFSNQVINICEMAKNHLDMYAEQSLKSLTERLGIDAEGDIPGELRCRQIWQIYCRFDRSELERRVEPVSEPWHRKKYKVTLTTPISELRITDQLRDHLTAHGIDILWEVRILTWAEACRLFGKPCMGELEELLIDAGATFRPADEEDSLYGYPGRIRKLASEMGDLWKIRLFFEVFEWRYCQLQKVRRQKLYDRQFVDECLRINDLSGFTGFISGQLRMLQDVLRQFHNILPGLNEVCAMKNDDDKESILEICQVTGDIMHVYKQLMAFKRKIHDVKTVEMFRDILPDLLDLGEQLCVNVIDQLRQKCAGARKTLEEYLAGRIKAEDLSLSIHLDIDADTDQLMKKIDMLGENC